jgi:hypothetical protein
MALRTSPRPDSSLRLRIVPPLPQRSLEDLLHELGTTRGDRGAKHVQAIRQLVVWLLTVLPRDA